MPHFQRKRAVAIDAASGIGLAIVRRFAAARAEVIVLDLNAASSDAAASAIVKAEGVARSFSCNVADESFVAGIRCMSSRRARIHTPSVDGFRERISGNQAEKMKGLAASKPIGRMGQPDEVAPLALFLD